MAPRKVSRSSTPRASTPVPPPVTPITPPTPSNIALTPKRARTAASERARSWSGTLQDLWTDYAQTTSKQLMLCDALQLFLMLTGVAQFLYCILVTNYPFNAFLGGFSATVGQFVLTASLRSQVNPKNRDVFPTISPERAFGDFVFGSLVLHFFVFSYLG